MVQLLAFTESMDYQVVFVSFWMGEAGLGLCAQYSVLRFTNVVPHQRQQVILQ
jgi:hypothetical protein